MTIAIVGAGKLGLALAKALVKYTCYNSKDIILMRRHLDGLQTWSSLNYVISNDYSILSDVNIIIITVEPCNIQNVLTQIFPYCRNKSIWSFVNGYTLHDLEANLPSCRIVRLMTNLAITQGQGCTFISNHNIEENSLVEDLFSTMGSVFTIPERLMAAATTLGASSLAYNMLILRATVMGAVQLGFAPEIALDIALQSWRGTIVLLQEESSLERNINNITTPNGCTIRVITEMEKSGLTAAILQGLLHNS